MRGQRRTTTLGRAEALGKGAGDSVTGGGDGRRQGRAPDYHSRAEALPEEPTAGMTVAAVAGGENAGAMGEGESWHHRRG